MKSAVPKVLHPLCGRPLITWPVAAAHAAGAARVIVVDNPKRRLEEHLPEGVEVAIQEEPKGTGDAVAAAAAQIDPSATVVVINGDVALLTGEAIKRLVEAHETAGAAGTMATMELDEPGAYGRVIRDSDGSVLRVAEAKGGAGDATPEELQIREVNSGVYAFDGGALIAALSSSTRTTPRASCTCPTSCRRCATPGSRCSRIRSATPTSRTASTTASTSRTRTRSRSGASARSSCSAA